jgi:hypothetical protein
MFLRLGRRGNSPPYGPTPQVEFRAPGSRGWPSRDDPAGLLFMLLEPRQGGKAGRIIGDVAKQTDDT